MHAASSAVVRLAMMSIAIAVYTAAVSASGWGGGTDANIGAGLVGFAGLTLLSFGWALLDGRAFSLKHTIMSWSIVAAALAIGWRIVLAVVDADPSLSVAENLAADLSLTFFFFGLVLVPASVGALVGEMSRRRDLA
jgi:hypothetical protein